MDTNANLAQLEGFKRPTGPEDRMTTEFGTKVQHTDDSLKAGPRGPTLLEDFHLREKITHFDHERIPERVVHARGTAVHGYFELYQSQSDVTSAGFLNDTSIKTPVFVRFSTVLGSRGSTDTARDVRGFATRFYTQEGNFDLVGNNIPVFFIQDGIKFPDIVHAGKPEPHNEIPQASTAHDNFWDFISLMPESAHMVMWVLSDRAIPRSYRMMQGFGVHTFSLINAQGERRFVKFHWRPLLGTHSLAWDEAMKLGGVDTDFHRRDLWEAIEAGHYPQYELGLQIVEEKDEDAFDFDLLDATKIIPEELVPIRWVGRMTLNQNPSEFFSEVEQVAFCVQNIVPGIGFTDDPLFQARLFSYLDTQLLRLGGPNFQDIPINRPICPVRNFNRDGFMRYPITPGRVNYHPNRYDVCPPATTAEGGYKHHPATSAVAAKERLRGPKFQERYNQATLFWNSLSQAEKEHLVTAARFELGRCSGDEVKQRMLACFNEIDHDLAVLVAEGLGLSAPAAVKANHGKSSPALSQENTAKSSIMARRVAFLCADGFDATQLNELRAALKAGGAMSFVIGPHGGTLQSETGALSANVDMTFFTCKSIMFDAVVVIGGAKSVATLTNYGETVAFVNEAFKHCKPIGAIGEGVAFVRSLGLPTIHLAQDGSEGVVSDRGVVSAAKFVADAGAVEGLIVGSVTGLSAGIAAGPVAGVAAAAVGAIGGAVAGALAHGGGEFATAFIKAMMQHRFWYRDVQRVPA
eukprot:TRINITY_DN2100_c0_g1_i1.p1 TRINITY_DN2100_c0_g1~~TRINITY_DN2100_c0_g1_i1.p1  ORF type:complete len:748 (+),score=193.00 TRINITY_DN2100_c0_g1_i1:1022-3265(+)